MALKAQEAGWMRIKEGATSIKQKVGIDLKENDPRK